MSCRTSCSFDVKIMHFGEVMEGWRNGGRTVSVSAWSPYVELKKMKIPSSLPESQNLLQYSLQSALKSLLKSPKKSSSCCPVRKKSRAPSRLVFSCRYLLQNVLGTILVHCWWIPSALVSSVMLSQCCHVIAIWRDYSTRRQN